MSLRGWAPLITDLNMCSLTTKQFSVYTQTGSEVRDKDGGRTLEIIWTVFLPHKHKTSQAGRSILVQQTAGQNLRLSKSREKRILHEVTVTLLRFSPTLLITASSSTVCSQDGSERFATALLMALISYHVLDVGLCLFLSCSS